MNYNPNCPPICDFCKHYAFKGCKLLDGVYVCALANGAEGICVEKDGQCACDPCRCDKGDETTEGGW